MTKQPTSTNATAFRVGDLVFLNRKIKIPATRVTLPVHEPALVADVDPDDRRQLLLQLLRPFSGFEHWRNMAPARSDQVRLIAR